VGCQGADSRRRTGKGGGVKLARSLDEVRAHAEELLGKVLVTHQTGPEGKEVKRLLIEEGCKIEKEYYVGMVIDRSTGRVTLMASEEGGTEIEEVAARTPEKIIKESIDPAVGLLPFQARRSPSRSTFPRIGQQGGSVHDGTVQHLRGEGLLPGGNQPARHHRGRPGDGAGRQAQLRQQRAVSPSGHPELRDLDEEDPREVEASKYDLSYIALDGNIGCMVNGAGLAMATMDIIKHYGGEPANFLDVGGGASAEKVTEAFKIILSDENVKGILVNIFGGIMKCDVIATGVVEAAKQVGLDRPLVVRLEGNQRGTRQEDSGRVRFGRSSPPIPWRTRRRRSSPW
jgi:succinyl-CoA synthetase beta subunit